MEYMRKVFGRQGADPSRGVEFWHDAEHAGWLLKQGDVIRTWRRRWFVLKAGLLAWFKDANVTEGSEPRGIIELHNCLSVRGAEDALNNAGAFEVSTTSRSMYFIAESAAERSNWINSIGRVLVQSSGAFH